MSLYSGPSGEGSGDSIRPPGTGAVGQILTTVFPFPSFSFCLIPAPSSSVLSPLSRLFPLHSCLPLLAPPLFPPQGTPALYPEVVPSDPLPPRSLPASRRRRPAWHSAAMGMFEPGAAPNSSCWSHVASGCFGVADAAEEPHLQTFYYIFINFNFSRLMCQRPLNWTREL